MRIEVPDNAREAFQFLAFGAGLVLAIRLAVAAFGLWTNDVEGDALAAACAPFHNGYLLMGRHTLVVGGMAMIPRIAIAGLFVLLCAMLLALVAWSIGKVLRWQGGRPTVLGARIGLLLGGTWAIYCLLCLPSRQAEVNEKEIVLHDRMAFLGEIPWPIAGYEEHLPLASINQFFINGHPEDKDLVVAAYIHNEAFLIARAPAGTAYDDLFAEQWSRDANRLVAVLEALPR